MKKQFLVFYLAIFLLLPSIIWADCDDDRFKCGNGKHTITWSKCYDWSEFSCTACHSQNFLEHDWECNGYNAEVCKTDSTERADGCSYPDEVEIAGVRVKTPKNGFDQFFTEACNQHDICYATFGRSREKCDDDFSTNMNSICRAYPDSINIPGVIGMAGCLSWAEIFYSAVSRSDEGKKSHKKGQDWAVKECIPNPPKNCIELYDPSNYNFDYKTGVDVDRGGKRICNSDVNIWLPDNLQQRVSSFLCGEGIEKVRLNNQREDINITLSCPVKDLSKYGFNDKATDITVLGPPTSNCVDLYDDSDFKGEIKTVCDFGNQTLADIWKNRVSSFKCGDGIEKVKLFDTDNNVKILECSQIQSSMKDHDFDNKTTRVELVKFPLPNNCVDLYDSGNFTGEVVTVCGIGSEHSLFPFTHSVSSIKCGNDIKKVSLIDKYRGGRITLGCEQPIDNLQDTEFNNRGTHISLNDGAVYDNCVDFFEGENFSREVITVCGFSNHSLGSLRNRLSSIKCGSDIGHIKLSSSTGEEKILNCSRGIYSLQEHGFDNKTSSLKLGNCVQLYEGTYLNRAGRGASISICGFEKHSLPENWKNRVSSIKCDNSVEKIKLIDNNGDSKTLNCTTPINDLHALGFGNKATTVEPLHKSERTIVFIYGQTNQGQDMFIRGGIDWVYAKNVLGRDCSQDKWLCAIPIEHSLFKDHVQRANDHYLDWYGEESGQGLGVEGSPLVWTTNNTNHGTSVINEGYGYTPINEWGDHYWMLDVEMDCSKTNNGWFELKSYVSNGPGWEQDIHQSGTPYESNNHFAQCGKINVFKMNANNPIIIKDMH